MESYRKHPVSNLGKKQYLVVYVLAVLVQVNLFDLCIYLDENQIGTLPFSVEDLSHICAFQ